MSPRNNENILFLFCFGVDLLINGYYREVDAQRGFGAVEPGGGGDGECLRAFVGGVHRRRSLRRPRQPGGDFRDGGLWPHQRHHGSVLLGFSDARLYTRLPCPESHHRWSGIRSINDIDNNRSYVYRNKALCLVLRVTTTFHVTPMET